MVLTVAHHPAVRRFLHHTQVRPSSEVIQIERNAVLDLLLAGVLGHNKGKSSMYSFRPDIHIAAPTNLSLALN